MASKKAKVGEKRGFITKGKKLDHRPADETGRKVRLIERQLVCPG